MEMGLGEVSVSRELRLDQLLPGVPVDGWWPQSSLLALLPAELFDVRPWGHCNSLRYTGTPIQ